MTSSARGQAELDALDAVFHALAHRSRRTILAVLLGHGGTMTSGQIAAWFETSWPTTSRHLRVLERAGLVRVRLSGREHLYDLSRERLDAVAGRWLERFSAPDGDGAPQDVANR